MQPGTVCALGTRGAIGQRHLIFGKRRKGGKQGAEGEVDRYHMALPAMFDAGGGFNYRSTTPQIAMLLASFHRLV